MQKQILSWYIKFGDHTLPWRQTKDPYKIWISEIMLQQTQVKTVIPYYKKWIKNYPSIKILSNTSLDHILLLWQGLGYYKRATNILDTVQMLFNDFNNKFPRDYKDMIKLKGIGDYTASAILAIAFNKYSTPIDGNLKRILSRLYMLSKNRQTPARQWVVQELRTSCVKLSRRLSRSPPMLKNQNEKRCKKHARIR